MSEVSGAPAPDNFLAMLEKLADSGWTSALGVRFTRATSEEVVAELTIGPVHRQPYGILHGGVYASLVETVASAGAAIEALPEGRYPVGLDNHTSFTRAVREGVLRATGRALVRGRQSHLWEVNIEGGDGKLVSTGRVRFLIVDKGTLVGGGGVELAAQGAPASSTR